MFYNASGKKIKIEETDLDYIEFGYGQQPLVILPGLSDGLRTVRGLALTLAFYYRQFS